METMQAINNNFGEPLIWLVEDDDDKRELRTKQFKKRGCSVVSFSHTDDALKHYFSSPTSDLVVTDIDFDGSGKDKSGVAFARLLKNIGFGAPVCGYSSFFGEEEDNDLTEEEKIYFDYWYDKSLTAQKINIMLDNLVNIAKDQKKLRRNESINFLNELRAKHSISLEEYEQIRNLILDAKNPSDIESALAEAKYGLRIVQPKSYKSLNQPFLIWAKEHDSEFEVEVYSQPNLYSTGSTEEESINNLIELMQLFLEDILGKPDADFDGPALRLKRFLEYIFCEKVNDN